MVAGHPSHSTSVDSMEGTPNWRWKKVSSQEDLFHQTPVYQSMKAAFASSTKLLHELLK
jgi:hypothetical protein